MPNAPSEPANPCIRNCCLDANEVCLGCHRTLKEILDWHRYTPAEKQALLVTLAERRNAHSKGESNRAPRHNS